MPRPPVTLALLFLLACARPVGHDPPAIPRADPVHQGLLAAGGRARPPRPPEPGERPVRSATPRRDQVSGRVALVIGIDRYRDAPDLTAAVADARLLADALVRLGFDEVRLLLDRRATRTAILRSVRHLARASDGEQPAVLFYAGHVRRTGGDPDGDGEELDEALLAADGRPVYDGELARALRPASGPLWLAYAGCYAGGFSDAARAGRVSTYAAPEHRLAYESPQLGQSFMVEFMVARALIGEGLLQVEEMYRYASNHMVGRDRRFRPVQDDRVPGSLVLGEPAPPPEQEQEPGTCLLPCRSGPITGRSVQFERMPASGGTR
ncbi:MAG: caspase family protein [Actinomycetota bacterium]|nr:caspase family protein [Actinomycetota bacterium]